MHNATTTGKRLDDEQVGRALELWKGIGVRCVEWHRVGEVKRAITGGEPHPFQRPPRGFDELHSVLIDAAEREGIDPTALILFRDNPTSFDTLNNARAVVERLARRMGQPRQKRNGGSRRDGGKKQRNKQVQGYLNRHYYSKVDGLDSEGRDELANRITIGKIVKSLKAGGYSASNGSVQQTPAWKAFHESRKKPTKARRVNMPGGVEDSALSREADPADIVANQELARLTAEQERDGQSQRILSD